MKRFEHSKRVQRTLRPLLHHVSTRVSETVAVTWFTHLSLLLGRPRFPSLLQRADEDTKRQKSVHSYSVSHPHFIVLIWYLIWYNIHPHSDEDE